MTPVEWKPAKVIRSSSLPANDRVAGIAPDERERDMRPGRFAVTGQFIKLPERSDADSESPRSS